MGGKEPPACWPGVREESIGKSGDGTFTRTRFWNLRAKAMGFALNLSLYSETAHLKDVTCKDIYFVLDDLTSDTH